MSNNEKSHFDASKTNKNNTTRNRLFGTVAAVAAGAGIVAGLAHNTGKTTSREEVQIGVGASQIGISEKLAKELLIVQRLNDDPGKNPTELPSYNIVAAGNHEVPEGANLTDVAKDAYLQIVGGDPADIPDSVLMSITFTARTEENSRRDAGESAVLQPGELVGVTVVNDPDSGSEYVVVSDEIQFDTN